MLYEYILTLEFVQISMNGGALIKRSPFWTI